ncbi:MAG: hypothetical protein LBJ43_00810 [Propionibacteriaceae bacterium]|jgi:hypothetical protein|nr:hypothetical protein [Propionibacteriaceae bacterium]
MRETKKSRFANIVLAFCLAITAMLGLSACSSDEPTVTESEAFVNDMKDAVKIINDMVAQQPGMTQIMLASDVEQPTQKYGMWVMPYYPSDAIKKFTMTVPIKNGSEFFVTCISAATDKTWQMDQDGKMTEAAAK